MSAKATASGHAVKHTKTSKAAKKTAKHRPNHHKLPATHKATGHKVTAKATHAKHAKAVGFAVGDLLPVCAFEAVAMSARLAGYHLSDDDTAGLWDLLGAPEEGVPVGEALRVAARQGIGGVRPGQLDFIRLDAAEGRRRLGGLAAPRCHFLAGALGPFEEWRPQIGIVQVHGLILHVDVPGPHAVLATPDGWWSWGERYDPWPCRISEAWAVSWS